VTGRPALVVPSSQAKARLAPVAQGIEHRPPEAGAQVRILPGARIRAYRPQSRKPSSAPMKWPRELAQVLHLRHLTNSIFTGHRLALVRRFVSHPGPFGGCVRWPKGPKQGQGVPPRSYPRRRGQSCGGEASIWSRSTRWRRLVVGTGGVARWWCQRRAVAQPGTQLRDPTGRSGRAGRLRLVRNVSSQRPDVRRHSHGVVSAARRPGGCRPLAPDRVAGCPVRWVRATRVDLCGRPSGYGCRCCGCSGPCMARTDRVRGVSARCCVSFPRSAGSSWTTCSLASVCDRITGAHANNRGQIRR
jgi:hypothetical protein